MRDFDEVSKDATDTIVVTGSWGKMHAPYVVTSRVLSMRRSQPLTQLTRAQDAVTMVPSECYGPGISSADMIRIHFESNTNVPPVHTQELVDRVIFTPTVTVDWGIGYVGKWETPSLLVVTLGNTIKLNPHLTRVDLLQLSVASPYANAHCAGLGRARMSSIRDVCSCARVVRFLISEDESSDASQYVFSGANGTWGQMVPPVPVGATAFDTGNQPGLGPGDTVHVYFDSPTDMPVLTTAEAASAVSWSSNVGRIAVDWVAWDEMRVRCSCLAAPPACLCADACSAATQITLLYPWEAGFDEYTTAIGELMLSLHAAGRVRSADTTSLPSTVVCRLPTRASRKH